MSAWNEISQAIWPRDTGADAMSEPLWCMHIIGPDEVHAYATFEEAERAAIEMNIAIRSGEERTPELRDVLCRAVVAIWPWSDERHAADLAKREPTR